MIKLSFNACDFIFDGISSSQYGMMIAYLNNDRQDTFTVSKHTINTYKSKFGKSKILDIQEDTNRSFDISLVKATPIAPYEIDSIFRWLMPKDNKFRKLYINDEKYQGYYYYCKILEIEATEIAGYPYAIKCKIECNSQYSYSDKRRKIYNSPTLPLTVNFINDSCTEMKPTFKFKCNLVNGCITLQNQSTNKTMTLNNLSQNETITIDCEEQSINSDLSYLRLNNFNKEFMDFKIGINKLVLTGNVDYFEFEYQNAKIFGN